MDMSQGNRVGRLVIRVMERQDVDFARRLHNDDSTLLQLSDVEHVSETQQEAWFQSVSSSKKSKRYTILDAGSGDYIGIFRVDMLDLVNRNVCVGLDIAPEMRGKGYAKEIYRYFLDYYFLHFGMHRLYLAVLATNDVARSLYGALGFREEGVHREAIYRGGEYVNLIWMSILREEFDARRNNGTEDK
jgi:RimJ/RimL family protein N-acetyltransferase